jgi:diguanylate cyclase
MSDYKERYSQAVKLLQETERESLESLSRVYSPLLNILSVLKGRHHQIDKAIAELPKTLSASSLPTETLERIGDLLLSHNDKLRPSDSMGMIEVLLQQLKLQRGWETRVNFLHAKLKSTHDETGRVLFIRDLVSEIVSNEPVDGSTESADLLIEDYKGTLFQLLNQLTADLAESLDVARAKKGVSEAEGFKDLSQISKDVFSVFDQTLSKKNKFILELSGLIETVANQLQEFSTELEIKNTHNKSSNEDRWRFTELIDKEVNSLTDSVVQAENLDGLKSVVSDRLEYLNKSVSDFVELEVERAKEAEINTKNIELKLGKVESEVAGLKSSLERARDEALVDPLTGVANRRAYEQRIHLEIERWKRKRESLVVAIMDIDHFKNVNDSYGHPVGDKVLRTISQLVNKQVRESDFFGRMGGEEFAVIFVSSNLENALIRLKEFCKSISDCKFGSRGRRVVITMSGGCAVLKDGDTAESLYERADQALLLAKNTGRNKCLSEKDLK